MHSSRNVKKLSVAGLIIAAAIAGVSRPAGAAVTSASFQIVGPNPVNAPCPATVNFTGVISYTAGTRFAYSFNRYVNGAQQVVPGPIQTMPPSGSIQVSDAITISSSTGANTFDQIWVHNISGGQSDVYSNRTDFSVSCQGAPGIKNVVGESPANTVAITDLTECTKRAPSMACGFILADSTASHALVLGWDVVKLVEIGYHPGIKPGPADGFKIYRVDGGRDDLIAKQPFENTRVSEIPKPADGSYIGKCYAVTAYNALAESSASAPYCVGMVAPAFHTVLRPIQSGSRYRWHRRANFPTEGTPSCSQLCVGWNHDAANGTDFGWQSATAWRSYLLFSPAAIRGIHATRATLKLRNSGDSGCVDKVSMALADWWDNTSWIDGAFGHESSPPTAETSSGATFDVTLAVWLWASGQEPNYGFVITGRDEDTGANDTTHCVSQFNPSAVLDIEQ